MTSSLPTHIKETARASATITREIYIILVYFLCEYYFIFDSLQHIKNQFPDLTCPLSFIARCRALTLRVPSDTCWILDFRLNPNFRVLLSYKSSSNFLSRKSLYVLCSPLPFPSPPSVSSTSFFWGVCFYKKIT